MQGPNYGPPGYGAPPQPNQPYGYAPTPPQPPPYGAPGIDPNRVGATEIFAPLLLSLFCGVGGFVWGFIKMAQGHNKPGWVAVAINGGVWLAGFVLWFMLFFIMGVAGAAASAP
jgi:hypothetical protein